MASSPELRISVVVVSDYAGGGLKDWTDEQTALEALARQDIGEPFEIVLVENERYREEVPPSLLIDAPRARLIFSDSTRSAGLKDDGVAATTTPLVAVIEADCFPAPDWLRHLCGTIDSVREADVVSGRTTYGQTSALLRVFALLDRAYLDLGHDAGPIRHISNNGALYRREILDAHPYREDPSPFVSADVRLAEILEAGFHPYFQPSAVMVHRFTGFGFIVDLRANSGFQAARWRLSRRGAPPTWIHALVAITLRQTRIDLRSARRAGRAFLKPWDWVLYVPALLLVRVLEWPGIVRALKGYNHLAETGYR